MQYNQLHTIDLINAFCTKESITDDNFLACTFKVPLTSDYNEQLEDLTTRLKELTTKLSGCFEWSDKRADGWHFHFITSASNLFELIGKGVHIVNGYDLDGWISYLTKQAIEKRYISLDEQASASRLLSNTKVKAYIEEATDAEVKHFPSFVWFRIFYLFRNKVIRMMLPPIRPAPNNVE